MNLLCIDPGPKKSGVIIFDGNHILFNVSDMGNDDIIEYNDFYSCRHLAIEGVACYGMAVGASVFNTCISIGRFIQAFKGMQQTIIYRKDVKMCLCHNMRAKDANIRQAILDRFPATGGGKTPQVGTKKQPGPLFGISKHAWSALAVGITYFEENK